MNTINLQISMPADLYNKICNLNINKQVNEIILEAVTQKIQKDNSSLKSSLIEGYKQSSAIDKQIIQDFSTADYEHWDEK